MEDRIRGRRTGIHAAVAIHDTINTVVGTSPRNGLINDASCAFTLVCLAIYLYCSKVHNIPLPQTDLPNSPTL